MKKIQLEQTLRSKSSFFNGLPKIIFNPFLYALNKILKITLINNFIQKNNHLKGIDFIDAAFQYLDFSYFLSNRDLRRIPAEGKLIVVSNHPLGALDGLALIKALSQARDDIMIVVNDVLMAFENMNEFFIPYDVFSGKTRRTSINLIRKAINEEKAVVFFPAAEVSRIKFNGIKDNRWRNGPVKLAAEFNVPISPVFIKARNSLLFYLSSIVNNKIPTFLLAREIFKKRGKNIMIKIGDPIDSRFAFQNKSLNAKDQTSLLKKHVYRVGKGKKGVFKTYQTIIHPVKKILLKKELKNSRLLKEMDKGVKVYLTDGGGSPNLINEIGRLREQTFRKVGEGTWKNIDIDEYDRYYQQIVVWNEEALEIMGAYRVGVCGDIHENQGLGCLYTESLFDYDKDFMPYLKQGLELGRSFVQEKYWRTNILEYLWHGIGAMLSSYPNVNYLFGAVSISDNYSDYAKKTLVYYYKKWFSSKKQFALSKNRFLLTQKEEKEISLILNEKTKEKDYKILKGLLKNYGFTVPILFKKYTDLCEKDGVFFLDFGVDADFSNTVDGLIFMDLNKLKGKKKLRYSVKVKESDKALASRN